MLAMNNQSNTSAKKHFLLNHLHLGKQLACPTLPTPRWFLDRSPVGFRGQYSQAGTQPQSPKDSHPQPGPFHRGAALAAESRSSIEEQSVKQNRSEAYLPRTGFVKISDPRL